MVGNPRFLGKRHSEETLLQMSRSRLGAGNGNWKGGVEARKAKRSLRYERKTSGPGAKERRQKLSDGLKWCSKCADWRQSADVRRGLCREHRRENERERYRDNPSYRARRKGRGLARRRGVERLPEIAVEFLTDIFKGQCAYCDHPAQTWDHVVPVTKGGQTTPDNILPACGACNSSKRDRDLLEWLDATGRQMKLAAVERLAHYQVLE